MSALLSCRHIEKYFWNRSVLKKSWKINQMIKNLEVFFRVGKCLCVFWTRGIYLTFYLKILGKSSSSPLIHRQGWFFMSERKALKNVEKWWSNLFLILTLTKLKSFLFVSESAFEDQLTMPYTFQPFNFLFSRRWAIIQLFLKKFGKNFVRSFDPPPMSRLIFYDWVNSPEKMMKNGGRIIYLS